MQQNIIDLSHVLNEEMTIYPGTLNPVFESSNTIEIDGFAEKKILIPSHIGTHIDAPCHILRNAKSLDLFPIDKFIGNALVIFCLDKKDITLDYLKTFSKVISDIDFILFFTGWDKNWNTQAYFDNFPTLTEKATKWLTTFKLKGLGFDAISVDKITSTDLPNHHMLLKNEILIIENLTNLNKLPMDGFTFQCLPLKIENADGSPVRAIAWLT